MSLADSSVAERLAAADAELARLNEVLMRFWLERHKVYAAIRDLKMLRRKLELTRAELLRPSR